MSKELPVELVHARELMVRGKLDEALENIEKFERSESLSSDDRLSALLLKGEIQVFEFKFKQAVNSYELAYQICQEMGLIPESVESLIGKSYIVALGDVSKGLAYVEEAEKIASDLIHDSSIIELKKRIMFMKSWISFFQGDGSKAEYLAQESLKLYEPEGYTNKAYISILFTILSEIFVNRRNFDKAQDYATRSLRIQEELNLQVGMAHSFFLLGRVSRLLRKNNLALKYYEKSLSIDHISNQDKINCLNSIATVHRVNYDLDKAIEYSKQAVVFAEEEGLVSGLSFSLISLAYWHRGKGENDQVIKYAERVLKICEKNNFTMQIFYALGQLIFVYISENQREKANRYFTRLSELYHQIKEKGEINTSYTYLMNYLYPKAYLMKTSTRMRDRVEAQDILKQLIDQLPTFLPELATVVQDALMFSIANLCDLLLEELSMNNDEGILDEIIQTISKGLEIADLNNDYGWVSIMKLLQAKLALIRLDIDVAKRLMVDAQHDAEFLGVENSFIASGISFEHDKFLQQIDLWDKLKKENAPISERISLASMNGVLDSMQGKGMIKSPEEVDEEPILLLIMDNSGTTYFSHSFLANWDHSDLFSSFMSAFNTFIDEIFSNSIDRIKVKENTILINPIEQFLACYVIKGQSYPALQKLSRFTEAIRENSEIWQALEKSVKTSEMLELDKPPELRTVIDEIFD